MKYLLRISVFLVLCAGIAHACWQTYEGPTLLTSSQLRGRLSWNGNGITDRFLTLHIAKTFTRDEVWKNGIKYDKDAVARANTDIARYFDLGPIKPGKYWLVYGSESFALEVRPQVTSRFGERISINGYADGCWDVRVLDPNQPYRHNL